ncbi:hypothetical protein [Streptomyces rubradiris]|uniref:Uncharacterized protein n=1 Tax=Streptomyces rubradiris TaxID=285531 RepID=A0ABQ3RC64_STRRR|nr:hypothetical protein [Streptomyces rubradiris]GHG93138.1 hypothetical protein GCM10018792_01880 [Streptomyces rubradiris]GHI53449.1 hypothetical protein Srubr_32950 [Streptomyces rubradiris]
MSLGTRPAAMASGTALRLRLGTVAARVVTGIKGRADRENHDRERHQYGETSS